MNILIRSILVTVMLTASLVAGAQESPRKHEKEPGREREMRHEERGEKVKTWKIAFITEKLDLTPDEAQKFWPVYNEYENKLEDLRKKRRQERRSAKENIDEMTDKEVEAMVDSEMTFRQKELDLQKEYHGKFKSVLPVRKVGKLYAAEEQFRMEIIKKIGPREKR